MSNDLANPTNLVAKLAGCYCWRAQRGYGTFLTFDFSDAIPEALEAPTEGWYLWVYGGDWKLDGPWGSSVSHEDGYEMVDRTISEFAGKNVESAKVDAGELDLELCFEDGSRLCVSPNSDDDTSSADWWLLYTPDGNVLIAGPGPRWVYEPAERAEN